MFKWNLGRSVIQVVQADGGGISLTHKKTNFGKLAEPVHLALEFEPDAVRITAISAEDERMAGIDAHLPAMERVACALTEHSGGVLPLALAEELGMSEKTVRNYLSALKQRGRADSLGDGRWRPIPNSQPLKGLGIGNDETHEQSSAIPSSNGHAPAAETDVDHDKRRAAEVDQFLAEGQIKKAKAAAERIRGRMEREQARDKIEAYEAEAVVS